MQSPHHFGFLLENTRADQKGHARTRVGFCGVSQGLHFGKVRDECMFIGA
jgi:hypothetical protein